MKKRKIKCCVCNVCVCMWWYARTCAFYCISDVLKVSFDTFSCILLGVKKFGLKFIELYRLRSIADMLKVYLYTQVFALLCRLTFAVVYIILNGTKVVSVRSKCSYLFLQTVANSLEFVRYILQITKYIDIGVLICCRFHQESVNWNAYTTA